MGSSSVTINTIDGGTQKLSKVKTDSIAVADRPSWRTINIEDTDLARQIATYTNIKGHVYCAFKVNSDAQIEFGAVTDLTLTYYYYKRQRATGSLNKSSVVQGKSIQITINSTERCPDFTYKVLWYRDATHQTTVDCGSDG